MAHHALVWVERASEEPGPVCCAGCGAVAPVGVQFAALGAAGAAGADPASAEWESNCVACELGCGRIHCSVLCRAAAERAGHPVLCVGPLETTEHPLHQFKLLALRSWCPETLQLAAELLVAACMVADDQVAQGDRWLQGLRKASASLPLWWELPLPPPAPPETDDPDDPGGWAGEARALATTAFGLLRAALVDAPAVVPGSAAPATVAVELQSWTESDWGRLLSLVAAEQLDLTRPSPAAAFLEQLAGDASSLSPAAAAAIVRFVRGDAASAADPQAVVAGGEAGDPGGIAGVEPAHRSAPETDGGDEPDVDAGARPSDDHGYSDSDSDSGSEGSGQAEWLGLDDDHLLARVLAEPAAFFPTFRAVAVVPGLSGVPHSCVPTAAVKLDPGAFVCSVVPQSGAAATDSSAPPTIARLDIAEGLEERTAAFYAQGMWARPPAGAGLVAAGCCCDRCRFERGGDGPPLGLPRLRELAAAAQAAHRNADALALFDAILAGAPGDPGALYGTARVTGWDDSWAESAVLMSEAAAAGSARAAEDCRTASLYADVGRSAAAVDNDDNVMYVAGLGGAAVVAPTLLDPAGCSATVAAVEAHLAVRGGWGSTRHFAVPTTDVPIHQIAPVLAWFIGALGRIAPILGSKFGFDPANLRVIDAFIVKYDGSSGGSDQQRQRHLPLHCDQSEFSLTIALNDRAEYVGGGTFFADIAEPVNCDAGGVIGFRGSVLHGGHPITAGVRYIAVAFLYAHGD